VLERDGFPPGVPCWVDTLQPNPDAAVAFAGNLFGWEFVDRMPPDVSGSYYIARLRARDVAAIGSQLEDAEPSPTWNTYIWVDSADTVARNVRIAGGTVLVEPLTVLDAGRMAKCADPEGAVFFLWEPGRHRGAQIVNEPNSWDWSDLNTRDLEGARAFYGAVFGWETDTFDSEFGRSAMVRLPGYADFLERYDPNLRNRHANAGVPPGFSDCIAWMQPLMSDQSSGDVQPHWSVTFSVADTDTVTTRVVDLGGSVLTPPFQAGPVRAAVVSDPQGAVFSISTYAPT
jgi:predicted enzyme related to lactoylglutathione lyase